MNPNGQQLHQTASSAKDTDLLFHLYGGKIEALTTIHNAFPEKSIYFTEQWVSTPGDFAGNLNWHVNNLIIGATRNWARNVFEWNLAADAKKIKYYAETCIFILKQGVI